jgi:hypothetical protein
LILLPDDLVHDLLDEGGAPNPCLVGPDEDLFAWLDRLLRPELNQVGAPLMLHNLRLDNMLWRIGVRTATTQHLCQWMRLLLLLLQLRRRCVLHALALHHDGAAGAAGHCLRDALMQRGLLRGQPLLRCAIWFRLWWGSHLEEASLATTQLELCWQLAAAGAGMNSYQLLPLGCLDLEVLVMLRLLLHLLQLNSMSGWYLNLNNG